MALDVNALSVYNDELSSGLIKEVILGANTIKGNIANVKYGAIGSTYKINSVKSTMFGVAASCGFTDTGSTVMAQETVELCAIQFPQSICLDNLKSYYYDWFMDRSMNTENLGEFEDVFYSNKVEAAQKVIDQIIWRGTGNDSNPYASVTGNLTLCKGFAQVAYDLSASTAANVAKTALTVSNAVTVVDSILNSVATNAPEILESFRLYMSPADFQIYLAALRTLNLYNYNTASEGISEILHPGSIGMKVTKTNGLEGVASGTFIATPQDNTYVVFSDPKDLEFKSWFSQDDQNFKMLLKLKFGVGFAFPELVVRVA
jgi:hypothetical protein